MADLLDLVDRLWSGEAPRTDAHHPVTQHLDLVEVTDRTAFIPAFGNVCGFDTDDGLVLVDTGNQVLAQTNHERMRGWNGGRLHTAVFSHGHIDHVFGVGALRGGGGGQGVGCTARRRPRAPAAPLRSLQDHRWLQRRDQPAAVPVRRGRSGRRSTAIPTRRTTITTTSRWAARRFELHHDKGETDDATWVWHADRKVLCTGDLFIWASPNCGNPQKVQRYPQEWAEALRKMAGARRRGAAARATASRSSAPTGSARRCTETAELLESRSSTRRWR